MGLLNINTKPLLMKHSIAPAGILLLFLSSCGSKKATTHSSTHREQGPKIEHELLTPEKSPWEEKDENPATENLLDFVHDWEGTPHRMGGNTKKGVDCSGFVIQAYLQVYNSRFQGRRAEDLFNETVPVKKKNLRHGDLVFFKINGRRIDHVGIYIQNGDFAHTSSSRGVMISNLNEAYFAKCFFMGGRKL